MPSQKQQEQAISELQTNSAQLAKTNEDLEKANNTLKTQMASAAEKTRREV